MVVLAVVVPPEVAVVRPGVDVVLLAVVAVASRPEAVVVAQASLPVVAVVLPVAVVAVLLLVAVEVIRGRCLNFLVSHSQILKGELIYFGIIRCTFISNKVYFSSTQNTSIIKQ